MSDFKARMHQIQFRRPLAGFKGATSKGKEGAGQLEGKGRKGAEEREKKEGRTREGREGGEGKGRLSR